MPIPQGISSRQTWNLNARQLSAVNLSNVASGIGGFAINGQATDDYSGRSVSSAGDVNGDGFADLIVGANRADLNGYFLSLGIQVYF